MADEIAGIWAADFFVVQTLTYRTLYVLFFVRHERRRLIHFNVTMHPTVVWVWQIAESSLKCETAGRREIHRL